MNRAYKEIKLNFDAKREVLKAQVKKVEAEVFTQSKKVQSLEVEVLSL